jgi:excisionase family DNA binding protein
MTENSVFLNTQQVADWLGVPKSTVDHWRAAGTGPTFTRLGKHVRYRRTDVLSWADERAEGMNRARAR